MLFVFGFITGVICTLGGLFLDIVSDSDDDLRASASRKYKQRKG